MKTPNKDRKKLLDSIIQEMRPVVTSIALNIKKHFGLQESLDELKAIGFKSLCEAFERYDPDQGTSFKTFSYYRIKGGIIDHMRYSTLIRNRPRTASFEAKANDYLSTVPKSVTHHIDFFGLIEEIDETVTNLGTMWLADGAGQSNKSDGTAEAQIIEKEDVQAIKESVDQLPEQERKVIIGHYFEYKNFVTLARELKISKSWISRVHKRALNHLKPNILLHRKHPP